MEGIALTLIGTAIFIHAWYLFGLFVDGRTVGIIMAGLGAGLLLTLTFDPQILGERGSSDVLRLAEITVMKSLIVFWAVYAAATAATTIWDLEERTVGFYGAALVASSATAVFYFATQMNNVYGTTVMLTFTVPAIAMTVLGAFLFLLLAVPLPVLRKVSAAAMLVGSIGIGGLGLAVMTTLITAFQAG